MGRLMPYLNSSAINYVNYDPVSKVLSISFRSGRTYDFYGVPECVYEGLLAAPSAGKFFHDNIRDQYSLR
ncbi:MAG: hypothetical protein DHS20C08_20140 [Rhodomicrobium sp.]|nr:MAG: hypothetical protein DHS20C08_20140 [Rhodomicrobium sp.]